jgi:hypothetical protein
LINYHAKNKLDRGWPAEPVKNGNVYVFLPDNGLTGQLPNRLTFIIGGLNRNSER